MGNEALKPSRGVQEHVDRLLRLYDGRERLDKHSSFHFVTSWCEAHPDEAGLYSGDTGDSFVVLDPAGEQDGFTDDELRDRHSLSDDTHVTDAQRVSHIRSHLDQILEGDTMDADVHPTACTIRLLSTKGREACLGYELRGYSFSGVEVTWLGLFDNIDDLRTSFRRRRFLTSADDLRAMDDRSLLAYWQG